MEKFILSVLLCFYIITGMVYAKDEALCDKYVRLHIIANSNTPYDQSVKESVKTFFLDKHKDKLSDFDLKEKSLQYITENKETIEVEINEFLKSKGAEYFCKIEVSKTKYNKNFYESIYLPKGEYDSVKIILGKGNGKNLFFIMFPSQVIKEDVTVKSSNKDKIIYKSKIAELLGI